MQLDALLEEKKERGMTIGQMARRAGVHIETVRYYERRGLLGKPPRSSSNYRIYSEETIRRMLFIKRAQKLGFTLKVIKELLILRERPTGQCAPAYAQFRLKIMETERQIDMLSAQLEALRRLAGECTLQDSGERCRLIEALDSDDELL
ncbi:MAG: MerR family transcriptional regulator [Chitinivibrionia bacterium]|nr:MerR family transcriptional regulator [Chitinivibrionia bacterium]